MGKKSKSVLPKKIAGVKVPKSVRKGQLGAFLASPTGQKLVAEAIVAVGAVAGARKAARSDKAHELAGAAKDKVADAKAQAGAKASDASGVIAYAIGEAVRSFADALRHSDGRQSDESASDGPRFAADDTAEESKKKPLSYEAGPL